MFKFETAVPVESGHKRQAEPNPFEKVIAEIAMKTIKTTGKPVARSFVFPAKTDEERKLALKYKRQLGEAGYNNDPKVTVRRHLEFLPDGTAKITFWTEKFVPKPKKAKTTPAPDTTPDTTPDATPDNTQAPVTA